MSTGEVPPADGETRKLGLDRLSSHGIELLGYFIRHEASHLLDRYNVELRRMLLTRDPEIARISIEDMAHSEHVDERITACYVVPYFAEKFPEQGFALWRELVSDSEFDVHETARIEVSNK